MSTSRRLPTSPALIRIATLFMIGPLMATACTPRVELEEQAFRGRPITSMAELMNKVVLPASDAILYISSRTPTTDQEWTELQGKALMLAESANLLLSEHYAIDDGQWIEDTMPLLEAGEAAYRGAMERDADALAELNDPLYTSCIICHEHYQPGFSY